MKSLRATLVLATLTLAGLFAPAAQAQVQIRSDTYAAVAYSPSTGKYGYGWNYSSKYAAERAALSECRVADARIVGWAKFGWLVLVVADDNAYGVAPAWGEGATAAQACQGALRELRKRSNAKVTDVVILCSGNVRPRVIKP
jgi:hypothetical protein